MRFLIVSKSSFRNNDSRSPSKGLIVPKMIRSARKKWDILDYLPEHKDCKLSNRGFYET